MQNVLDSWSALDLRRRILVAVAALATLAALVLLSRIASTERMELLYGGLEPGPAGEVIAALEQNGTGYEVRGNAIYVDAASRDQLRMILAGQGLPANGSAGYELLDGLSGFGTTSQMFDATYWRAKEGELARTILASPQVRAARVHIASPDTQGFRRNSAPTASVFVTPAGGALDEAQGNALRYLVASAVAGLRPDNVSVIDAESGAVLGTDSPASRSTTGKREEALKNNVLRLVEARVGTGNAIVETSLEIVTERESIVERRFDPSGRVAISTDTEERSSSASGQSGGAVTVASNLPDGDAGAGGGQDSSQDSETRERVNYEVSETQRELLRVPGDIKRLSVAVLVNGTRAVGDNSSEQIVPRTEEELETLHALIAAAVGFDEARGDRITIRSLAFEPVEALGTPATASGMRMPDLTVLAQLGTLAAVAIVLGLFVVRPILSNSELPARREIAAAPPGRAAQSPLPGNSTSVQALTGEIADDDSDLPTQTAGNLVRRDASGAPASGTVTADPVERLREMIRERRTETVEVLRSWMDDEEERA
ncbi:flagellar basal-body MS-ring/collar protein FliF [Tropicimonas sp.]|uniref:flagellar basal-body MS-ring/collar protein FliF n=1 Tax=Tropicimonas sp. TaxID=2067044 RepID=UPI003A88A64F